MMLWMALLDALKSLTTNKMRSGLTILGIVIGVAAVLAMVSIGRGAQNSITSSIQGTGSNLIFVMKDSMNVRNARSLTLGDTNAIADKLQAPNVAAVSAVIQGNLKVSSSSEAETVQVIGVSPNYAEIRNLSVADGSFVTDSQMQGRSSVAVLGPDTADTLFGTSSGVVGKTIRILGQPFKVIGVLEAKGGTSMGSSDDMVLVPLKTAQARLFKRSASDVIDRIEVSAVSAQAVSLAQEEVTEILQTRHQIAEGGTNDFRIFNQQDLVTTMTSVTNILTIFLGGVAGISLLVGGIGVMNIMLVTVTERTREIGLRKALGARRADILIQFLTESAMLSLIGGLIGIALGWGVALIVARVAAAYDTTISPSFGVDVMLLATLFSAAVGIFFGLYPANRAAGLEPVEALRYE